MGLRQKPRQSWGGGRHPRKWTFRRPVDGPVRGRPVAAPWTRHGRKGRFPRHPPHRGLTGPRSPRPPLTETRGSAADWGRPAGAEGSGGDGTPPGLLQPSTAPKEGFVVSHARGAVTLMILPQVHL